LITLTHEKINDVVDNYSTLIFRISFYHAKNKEDAEDITQEVFFSLLKKPKIINEEHLKAWLIRVAINKCKNLKKSASLRKNIPLDETTVHKYNFDESNIEVMECIQRLKPLDRDIIFLHYYEGFSAKEIGNIIEKKETSIFKRLERARDKLKGFLEEGE